MRLFDKSGSVGEEIFLGEFRILITETLLKQERFKSTLGRKCLLEEWYPLQGPSLSHLACGVS